MAQTDEERLASNVDALTAPEQATPGAAVLRRRRCILDSGTTIHAFSDGYILRNIRYLPFPRTIRVADGREMQALMMGDISMDHLKLNNVYIIPDLKMDLVSVGELAKDGIITTFYKHHAELWKGVERVGGAIAEGDTSLYEVTYLWATEDASDTTPEVPSGSEPWMMAATNGPSGADFSPPKNLLENSPRVTDDDVDLLCSRLEQKHTEYSYLMSKFKSRDDAAICPTALKLKIRNTFSTHQSSLASKFYQSDKTGGGVCCNNKFRGGSVHVKANMGLDADAMHEVDFIKSLKD